MEIQWMSPGRESVTLYLKIENDRVLSAQMKCIGDLDFLRFSQKMKNQLSGPLQSIPVPTGAQTASMIWRQIVLTAQGHWKIPVENEELCHCRKVSTAKVDEAIVYGAHDIVSLRKQTSANTGCATCLPDIESLLKNRLRE